MSDSRDRPTSLGPAQSPAPAWGAGPTARPADQLDSLRSGLGEQLLGHLILVHRHGRCLSRPRLFSSAAPVTVENHPPDVVGPAAGRDSHPDGLAGQLGVGVPPGSRAEQLAENRSITVARYSFPAAVRYRSVSPTHLLFGASAVKSRCTRSGNFGAVLSCLVNPLRRLILRATRRFGDVSGRPPWASAGLERRSPPPQGDSTHKKSATRCISGAKVWHWWSGGGSDAVGGCVVAPGEVAAATQSGAASSPLVRWRQRRSGGCVVAPGEVAATTQWGAASSPPGEVAAATCGGLR